MSYQRKCKYYIEREDAINEFNIRSSYYEAEWGNKRFTLNNVEEILRDVPAADVRPVVRGRWERTLWFVTCSVCGYTSADTDDEGSDISLNFCPNCGADMREDVKE